MISVNNNLIDPVIDVFRQAWRHRPEVNLFGRMLWEGQGVVASLLDTIDALGLETKAGLKPVIAHRNKTDSGWHIVLHLPPGISTQDVISKLDHFQEQCNSFIDARAIGPKVHFYIHSNEIPTYVPYEWTPPENMDLPIPLGYGPAGLQSIDLSRLPHMLVAGNTGGGKTTFLRTVVVALIQMGIRVVVIDLKGGMDYSRLDDHILLLDDVNGASEALGRINAELDRRKKILRVARVEKVQELKDELPWIVLVVDELAELKGKDNLEALHRLAMLSRATGIHLIVATQRPSYTLYKNFTDTRMLFSGRLCFHVPKSEDSRIVLDSDRASKLSPDLPGRAIWKWSNEMEIQCMNLTVKESGRIVQDIPTMGVGFHEQRQKRLSPR